MKNLTFGFFVILFATIASCAAISSKVTSVSGTITDAPNMKVYLDKVSPSNNTMVLAQTDSDASGSFSFKLEQELPPAVYRIRIGTGQIFLVLEDATNSVSVRGNLDGVRTHDVDIAGCASAKDFAGAMNLLATGRLTAEDVKDYVNNTPYPMAGMQMAMNAFGNRREFADIHKNAAALLAKKYPDHEYAAEYGSYSQALAQAAAAQPASNELIQVGMPAPEISMQSPDGKKYSLSDLKGKVVLLDFWASWCGPCRRANPHVVEMYHKYKDKGFTVYSVSLDGIDSRTKTRYPTDAEFKSALDQTKKNWLAAIEKDQLEWPFHVSELTKWESAAARTYGVSGIPKTFLIDREGKIAAVNPRTTLEQELLKTL